MLSGILKSVTSKIAPILIKAVAPEASKLLKKVVGDVFAAGSKILNDVTSKLPSPLRSLAKNLLSSFLPKLEDKSEAGIEKLINSLAKQATERFATGVGNITLPALQNRTSAMSTETSSLSSAATGASSGSSSASDLPPKFPSNPNDIGAMNKFNADMQAYQQRLSAMQNYWQMMSNILKSNSDTQKAMIANLR